MPRKPRTKPASEPDRGALVPVLIYLSKALHDQLEHLTSDRHQTVSDLLRAWILWELDGDNKLFRSLSKSEPFPEYDTPDGQPEDEELDEVQRHEQWRQQYDREEAERKAARAAERDKAREEARKNPPEHIRKIATARKLHPELPLRQFSQLLFDQDIYKSNAWDRAKTCAVNSATLAVWLKQAGEVGLLPKAARPHQTPRVSTVTYPRTPKP